MTCRVLRFPDRRSLPGRGIPAASAAPAGGAVPPASPAAESGGAPIPTVGAPPAASILAAVGWRLGAFAAVAWSVHLLLELVAALLRASPAGW